MFSLIVALKLSSKRIIDNSFNKIKNKLKKLKVHKES
jgi:hypothetical protein